MLTEVLQNGRIDNYCQHSKHTNKIGLSQRVRYRIPRPGKIVSLWFHTPKERPAFLLVTAFARNAHARTNFKQRAT